MDLEFSNALNLLHCSANILFITCLVIHFNVKPVKVEFDWEHHSIDENNGHTQSEWGNHVPSIRKEPSIIYSYKMKWETSV